MEFREKIFKIVQDFSEKYPDCQITLGGGDDYLLRKLPEIRNDDIYRTYIELETKSHVGAIYIWEDKYYFEYEIYNIETEQREDKALGEIIKWEDIVTNIEMVIKKSLITKR
ncbi:hypothetical protein [uncultured Kiloniella sp.]|uniref:hypothetical protein n=1 Tax=uncultured Kiloniella sp. TaxID=1133091 RepID=UPI00260BAA41|nr:hypothetical protein [uncultured Kiloniella sp.]